MGMADKILVVEDHPETRDSITILLELAGYTVVVANDGREGLAVFSKERPDLVITDIVMPGLNGLEMIMSVRHSFSGSTRVPIIALTGYYREFAKQMISAGADRALSKPVDPNTLTDYVKHLLTSTSEVSSPIPRY